MVLFPAIHTFSNICFHFSGIWPAILQSGIFSGSIREISRPFPKCIYMGSSCWFQFFTNPGNGVLRAESTEDSYEGTYLMFDTEAIDNVDRYESIKENKNMFTTL